MVIGCPVRWLKRAERARMARTMVMILYPRVCCFASLTIWSG
jgi:hypothetical protein